MNNDLTPQKLLQTATAFRNSKVLLSAVELGVFTELARGGKNLMSLTKALGLHKRSAEDFFDSLVSLGFLNKKSGIYSNTEETDYFLDKNKKTYIGGLFEMYSIRLFKFWANLTEALKTGKPQNEIRSGEDLFGAVYKDKNKLENFLTAMTGISMGPAKALVDKFPWNKYKTFCDVGSAQGILAVQIALKYPELHGYGLDKKEVEPIFNKYIKKNGLSTRIRFVGADFFKDEFPKADVYVMGHILQDWSLKEKKYLIEKAYQSLPKNGVLIVYDPIIDDERKTNTNALLMSLNMLIDTNEGFTYTGKDIFRWMKEAGFKTIKIEGLFAHLSMAIGYK